MSLSPEDVAFAREYGRRSAVEQGLPEQIEDPAVLARLATIFHAADISHAARTKKAS